MENIHVGKDVRTAAPSASLVGVRNGAAAVETGRRFLGAASTDSHPRQPPLLGGREPGELAAGPQTGAGAGCWVPRTGLRLRSSLVHSDPKAETTQRPSTVGRVNEVRSRHTMEG